MNIKRQELRKYLNSGDLSGMFVELGWNRHKEEMKVIIDKVIWSLHGLAEKAGFVVYALKVAKGQIFPDSKTRRSIEKEVSRRRREHLIVFVDEASFTQTWQWVRREAGRPVSAREVAYTKGDRGDLLLEKLERLFVSIEDDEKGLTVLDIAKRAEVSGQADKVTKKFYDQFKKQHDAFKEFITGISKQGDTDWYASLMLNRLMFIYFLQKKRFLDNDLNYLQNRLAKVRQTKGKNKFHGFYRSFLLVLFHQGLGAQERDSDLSDLIGTVPYLNGGLFDLHKLETENPKIEIPDAAFEKLFAFFDEWDWHLDERPLRRQNEINPDVLGFIFEKFINQKQMGAYYTKEDITEYITRSTVIPRLVAMIRDRCKVAFEGDTSVWRYVVEDPDRYIFPAVRHGISCDWRKGVAIAERVSLPDVIAAGIDDIPKRIGWNKRATDDAGLPTETWREVVARRQRCEEVRAKLAKGEVRAIEDFVTLNLDIRQFLQDVIERAEGPDLLDAIWQALTSISILDPTCGSGAFLFAALNVLEPLYEGALERMDAMLADWRRANPEAKKPPANSYMEKFALRLADVHRHPSERYFILKTIVLRNLYGVDLMEEAVEICKLRLFLKLVAQLDTADQIEPLPDLDFNVRAGNTLVGFATRQQVVDALERDLTLLGELPAIEEDAEIASRAFKQFREQQTRHGVTVEENREAKQELRRRLNALSDRLDVVLAKEYGIDDSAGKPKKFGAWKESHQPFHWFVEFYGILHDGGFDAIIGNPPYVRRTLVPYEMKCSRNLRFPDIYAHVLIRCLDLKKHSGGSGMIVPLSIAFSEDFGDLREQLQARHQSWFSSFDNIPASVFSGVSQRCTIWVGHGDQVGTWATPMYRWRAVQRDVLCDLIGYAHTSPLKANRERLPKLTHECEGVWVRLFPNQDVRTVRHVVGKSSTAIEFSPSARNFMSVFLESPPSIDAETGRKVVSSTVGSIQMNRDGDEKLSLAACVGEVSFTIWMVLADGFHVTAGNLKDILGVVSRLPDESADILRDLGSLLHMRRGEALVFKKNAGAYVGNYNYRRHHEITRRADMVLLAGLGANRGEVLAIFDYVQRLLSINESAGEKSIPPEVKSKFPPAARDLKAEKVLFTRADKLIREKLGFTQDEIDFLCEKDPVIVTMGEAEDE